jgi:hypothetical protein
MAVGREPDFHLAPTTEPAAWAATWKALIEWGHANGVDWLIGRTLPSMVSKLGLGRPQAKTEVQNVRGRDRGVTVVGSTPRRSTPPRWARKPDERG